MARAFDAWRSVALSLYMVLTGYAVLVGIPVISTAWVTQLGFTQAEVGWLAAADLGGLSLGAVLCSALIARVDRRRLLMGAALLAAAANLACIGQSGFLSVATLRVFAGVASGIYTAVAIAALGAHSNPVRAYGWVLLAFALSQAIELSVLPLLSIGGMYLLFAGFYLLALPFARWMPSGLTTGPKAKTSRSSALAPLLVLVAIFFVYLNIGSFWTYIELASLDANASPDWVGQVLIWSSLCSVLGCLAAGLLTQRFGLLRPLLLALMAQAAVVALLVGVIDDTTVLVSVFGFNFLWMFTDVCQLALLARFDSTGRFAALVPGAHGLGYVVGPTVAASLLTGGSGYPSVFVFCTGAVLIALTIYLGIFLRRRPGAAG